MKTKIEKTQVFAAGITVLLFAALIGIFYLYDSKNTIGQMLDDFKLKSERLLSEKLQLDKQIGDLKREFNALEGKNADLDKMLANAQKKISEKEAEISHINWDKNRSAKLQKELDELNKIKADLEKQMNQYLASLNRSEAEKKALEESLATLRSENAELGKRFAVLSAWNPNNYRVETTKGKHDKLTAIAKRTKKVTVGFDVPQQMVTNIRFEITNPEGDLVTSNDKSLTFRVLENEANLYASVYNLKNVDVTERIEMTYKPQESLQPGIYKIDVYDGKNYVGSCQIRLR